MMERVIKPKNKWIELVACVSWAILYYVLIFAVYWVVKYAYEHALLDQRLIDLINLIGQRYELLRQSYREAPHG